MNGYIFFFLPKTCTELLIELPQYHVILGINLQYLVEIVLQYMKMKKEQLSS